MCHVFGLVIERSVDSGICHEVLVQVLSRPLHPRLVYSRCASKIIRHHLMWPHITSKQRQLSLAGATGRSRRRWFDKLHQVLGEVSCSGEEAKRTTITFDMLLAKRSFHAVHIKGWRKYCKSGSVKPEYQPCFFVATSRGRR